MLGGMRNRPREMEGDGGYEQRHEGEEPTFVRQHDVRDIASDFIGGNCLSEAEAEVSLFYLSPVPYHSSLGRRCFFWLLFFCFTFWETQMEAKRKYEERVS